MLIFQYAYKRILTTEFSLKKQIFEERFCRRLLYILYLNNKTYEHICF